MGSKNAVFACFLAYIAFLSMLWSTIQMPLSAESSSPARRALASVVPITVEFNGEAATCTAFSVNQERGRFVTASHCAGGTVSIGFIPLHEIARDAEADLVLLQAREGGVPALRLGGEPSPGDSTLSIGYPLNSTLPMILPSMYQGTFKAFANGMDAAVFAGNSMQGMSGGPIVNARGEVVSVILGGGHPSSVLQNIGFGVPYRALRRLAMKWRDD